MAGRPSAASGRFPRPDHFPVAADVRRLTLKSKTQNPKAKGPSHFGCCKLRRRLPFPYGPASRPWTQPQSLPRGEPAFRGSWPVPLQGGVRGGFLVRFLGLIVPLLGKARGGFHVILHFIPARRQ